MKRETSAFWLAFACAVALTAWYVFRLTHILTDDAFITLQFARTIAESSTWGLSPGLSANAATSPLNVVVLAAITRIVGDPIRAAWLTATLSFVVILCTLVSLSREWYGVSWPGWIAYFALLLNPLLASTVGLETLLLIAALIVLLHCAQRRHYLSAVFCCAGISLLRPDGVLAAIACAIVIPELRKPRYAVAYCVAVAPWFLYSWVAFGSMAPDTLFLKLSEKFAWTTGPFLTGPWLYFTRRPFSTVAAGIFVVPAFAFGRTSLATTGRTGRLACSLGALYFAAYSVMRVPPFHWYYAPEITLLTIGAVFGISGTILRRAGPHVILTGMTVLVGALAVLVVSSRSTITASEAPMSTNWATPAQYQDIGAWIAAHYRGAVVWVSGETGTIAYYCECHVVNEFADPGAADVIIASVRQSHRNNPLGILMALDLAWRRPQRATPANYRLEPSAGEACKGAHVLQEWHTRSAWQRSVTWCFEGQP